MPDGQGTYTFADGRVKEGIWKNDEFLYAKEPSPTVTAKKTPTEGWSADFQKGWDVVFKII